MRKLFTIILSVLMLLTRSLGVSAQTVENGSSGSTKVYYFLSGQYAINIPASIILSQNDTISISADYAHLADSQSVVVGVASTSFGGDGYFELIANKDSSTIKCTLLASENGAQAVELTKENAPHTVLTVTEENKDTAIGTIQVIPQVEKTSTSGVYEGTMQFEIALVDNSEG